MNQRWLLAVAFACSSTKHEPQQPAPGYDPTNVPVAPAPNPTRVPVAPDPDPTKVPVAPPPSHADHPAASACPRSQPKACPATEPNVNHPCTTKGLQCTYGSGCCPPIYECNSAGVFEAHFRRCT
jgi:hypothetical protein